jgi:hypothetical protein
MELLDEFGYQFFRFKGLGVSCNGLLLLKANLLPVVSIEHGKYEDEVKVSWLLLDDKDESFRRDSFAPLSLLCDSPESGEFPESFMISRLNVKCN